MAITLGKDCTVSVDGTNVSGVRSVTFTESARTIDVNEFGTRYSSVYSTGFDVSVSIELNDDVAAEFITHLQDGTEITVAGGTGNWSFPAVVTGVSESCPIDGVATYSIEARMTRQGLR